MDLENICACTGDVSAELKIDFFIYFLTKYNLIFNSPSIPHFGMLIALSPPLERFQQQGQYFVLEARSEMILKTMKV